MIRPQRAILLCLIWLSAADLSFGETAATAPAGAPLAAVFFHSPTCLSCQKVQQRLTAIETRWRGRVIVEQYSVADASGLERLLLYEKRYGIEARNPPVVFVGDQCLAKAETILAELEDAIAAESAAGRRTWRRTVFPPWRK